MIFSRRDSQQGGCSSKSPDHIHHALFGKDGTLQWLFLIASKDSNLKTQVNLVDHHEFSRMLSSTANSFYVPVKALIGSKDSNLKTQSRSSGSLPDSQECFHLPFWFSTVTNYCYDLFTTGYRDRLQIPFSASKSQQ